MVVYWLYLLPGFCVTVTWTQPVPSRDSDNQYGTTSDVPADVIKSPCWLVADDVYRDQLSSHLGGSTKLIEMTLNLEGHPGEMLNHVLKDVYNAYHWVRSTSRQGRSLLMLDDNYRYKSLATLSIGVVSLGLNVTDQPVRCIIGRGPEETLDIIRESFLRDFDIPRDDNKGTFSRDHHICNTQILRNGQYAVFRYRCCQKTFDGRMSCHDLLQDDWVTFLLALIVMLEVLIVLYSPLFLPDSLYRSKYVAGQYIYHVPGKPLTLNIAVTQDPDQFGEENQHKTIRLSDLKNMEYFKAMVSNSPWVPDKIYEVQVREVRLSVKARRLLDGVSVPVTLPTMLYNNFQRCRIRRLEPLKECCGSDILGRFNPSSRIVTWHKCMRFIGQICSLLMLASPWIVRGVLYFKFEANLFENKARAAQELGLKLDPPVNSVLQLTPLHGLFIVVYVIFVIDSVIYGVISGGMKEKFKYVTRQCLRDMRERSRIGVLGWATRLTVMPFKVCGILGLIVFLPYLVILTIITLPVIAFYIFPTLNLSVRLLLHLFMFMCPRRLTIKFEEYSKKLTSIKHHLRTHEVTSKESFVRVNQHSISGVLLQLIIIIMCLISFWSITLLLMEMISFLVEIFVYTFMGIVVNAGIMLQYISVILLVFMYSKNTFSRVYLLYQSYHKVIHKQLMAMSKQEVTQVATQEALDQENTAFIVQGEITANKLKNSSPEIRVKNHKPQWMTFGMLAFLDSYDTPLTPEKFFYGTVDLKYFGCPGPIYRNVCSAILQFLKIVLFLLFVFVVVMALGDAYQISTTNQVLATVVGGFLPFIFSKIFKSSTAVDYIDTSSIQFKTEFHKAINSFSQSWPVFDIIPVSVKEWDIHQISNTPEEKILPPKTQVSTLDIVSLGGCSDDTETDDDGATADAGGDDADGAPSGEALAHEESTAVVDVDLAKIDIIVDVSSSKSRADSVLLNKDFERGSVSMLDRSRSNIGSLRMYTSYETV